MTDLTFGFGKHSKMLPATTNSSSLPSPSPVGGGPLMMDPRWKTNIEIAPNCPRCASTNTKFCYYNNYSLSQPRYFCKSCRRYWTKGGSLRNVPFGGGCRKNRRPKSSRTALPSHQQDGSDPALNNNTSLPTSSNSSSSSSDIDLALVFSNFLNSDPGLPLPVDDPSSLNSSDSFMQENDMDFIPDIELMEGLHHQDVFVSGSNDTGTIIYQQEERILQPPPALENVDLDPNGYGLQGLLSDEELLWSETNFSWQQMQVQSTWEQLPDDHAMFHQNSLLQGNWNSFDIPSYGT